MQDCNSYQKCSKPIVLFDGLCNLCSSSVQFLLTYNRKKNLHFASLQSPFAKNLLQQLNIPMEDLSTIIFVQNEKVYTKSSAVFELSKHLTYPWKAIHYFAFLPSPISNWFYDLIARNRYHWFGRKKKCMIPKTKWQDRFHG